MSDGNTPIWIPSDDRIKSSNFQKYFSFLKTHFAKNYTDYDNIYNWSIYRNRRFLEIHLGIFKDNSLKDLFISA